LVSSKMASLSRDNGFTLMDPTSKASSTKTNLRELENGTLQTKTLLKESTPRPKEQMLTAMKLSYHGKQQVTSLTLMITEKLSKQHAKQLIKTTDAYGSTSMRISQLLKSKVLHKRRHKRENS
jgi:hypothetical protein